MTLLLVAVGMPAFQQFKPGRIDHHNVQIALALLALAAAAWGERARWALAGGAVTGLALAVGLEGVLFLVIAGAAPALRWCVDRTSAPALRAYGLAVAAATLAGFLVSVGPDHWGRAACDTMAVNWMAPVVVAGLMLAGAATVLAGAGTALRCGAVAAIVVVAAAIFVSLEPRCLGGPFALIDPQLRPVWLGHVQEMQPLLQILRNELPAGAAILAFPLATLIAAVWLAREPQMRANAGFLVTATAAIGGIVLTLAAAKGYNYAVWMGMPLVAALALQLFARFKLTSLAAQVFVGIMLTPAVLSSGAMALAQTTGAKELTDSARVGRGCFDSKSYAELAHLPVGVVASDVDYGPFVLALTPHSALGGPYHRLGAGILAAHQVLALPPAAARQVIAAHGVRYLVTCGAAPPAGLSRAEREVGLWGRLAAGELPDWIEQRPDDQGPVFTVYRVKPDAGGGR